MIISLRFIYLWLTDLNELTLFNCFGLCRFCATYSRSSKILFASDKFWLLMADLISFKKMFNVRLWNRCWIKSTAATESTTSSCFWNDNWKIRIQSAELQYVTSITKWMTQAVSQFDKNTFMCRNIKRLCLTRKQQNLVHITNTY